MRYYNSKCAIWIMQMARHELDLYEDKTVRHAKLCGMFSTRGNNTDVCAEFLAFTEASRININRLSGRLTTAAIVS